MEFLHRPDSLKGALSDFPRRTGESEEAHRERYEEARKVRDKPVAQQTDYVQKLKTALQTYG